MPFVTGLTKDEMIRLIDETQERHCRDAFAADCRVAIRWRMQKMSLPMVAEYEFVVISPGDPMPEGQGWEIWENHSGRAVGRAL